jgi:hypothetical protein
MSKKELTIENIFKYKLQPSWGIIKLLKHFRGRKEGLETIYLRYIFIRNHDRDRFDKKTFRNVEGFYKKKENDISFLYKQKDIEKKPKKPPGTSLLNHLHKLVDIGIIYQPKKGFYKLKEAYEKEVIRDEIKSCIYSYDSDEFMELRKDVDYKWEIGNLLLGIDKETQKAFTPIEKEKIRENVEEIEKLLIEIDRIYLIRSSVEGFIESELMREHFGFENEREARESEKELIERERMRYDELNTENVTEMGVNPLTFVRFSSLTTFMKEVHKKVEKEKEMKKMMDIQIKAEKKDREGINP